MQIAKKLGVTPKEISDVFEKLGIDAQRYSQRDIEIGRLYYASRLSKIDIARKLGNELDLYVLGGDCISIFRNT